MLTERQLQLPAGENLYQSCPPSGVASSANFVGVTTLAKRFPSSCAGLVRPGHAGTTGGAVLGTSTETQRLRWMPETPLICPATEKGITADATGLPVFTSMSLLPLLRLRRARTMLSQDLGVRRRSPLGPNLPHTSS